MRFTKRMYLDVAAAMPVRKEAKRAYERALHAYGNPSSPHEEGREAKDILERARLDIARLTEVKTDDVVFTGGATEANAIAILGLLKPGEHALYLPSSHASVVENMQLAQARGASVEPLPVIEGRVDIETLRTLLRKETVLISMDAVCGETGTIWNTREVAEVLHNAKDTTAYLHVDASQAPLTQKISRAHFDADLLTLDASKVGGVRGIGCLIARRTISITPLYAGGGQERALRPGTESPALASAFAAALFMCVEEKEKFVTQAENLRESLLRTLGAHIPQAVVNEGKEHAPNILNISLRGEDTDYLVALLDEAGYAVSTRSACETDSLEGSRAVFVLTGDKARAKSTLRISWGPDTKSRDLERFIAALQKAVRFIDNGLSK